MALVSMNHTHTTSRHVQYKTFHNNNNRACLVPCWCRVDSRGRHSPLASFVTAIHALFINLANRVCPFFFEGAIISHFTGSFQLSSDPHVSAKRSLLLFHLVSVSSSFNFAFVRVRRPHVSHVRTGRPLFQRLRSWKRFALRPVKLCRLIKYKWAHIGFAGGGPFCAARPKCAAFYRLGR